MFAEGGWSVEGRILGETISQVKELKELARRFRGGEDRGEVNSVMAQGQLRKEFHKAGGRGANDTENQSIIQEIFYKWVYLNDISVYVQFSSFVYAKNKQKNCMLFLH